MNLRLAAVCMTVLGSMPLVATAQYSSGSDAHAPASVIRPVGYGPLWDDFDGGCGPAHRHHGLGKGCCGPIGCPYGVGASCGCGGCDRGCNYRIGCGLPLVFNRMTRSLDCLFPCRPKLLGCGSGWGGCSPCYDPSCGGGCPKPHFGRRFGGFGGCSKCDCGDNCTLGCSCGTPAATFGTPSGIPAPMPSPESNINPFQDDMPPEPMPTDARRNAAARDPYAQGPTPARRPTRPASLERQANGPAPLKALPTNSRVLRAAHTAGMERSDVQQASAETDDVIRNYTEAKTEIMRSLKPVTTDVGELPHNPLR